MKIILLVDSLRVGGIERNTLDQAYKLRDNNEGVLILVLNKSGTFENVNFVDLEKDIIRSKKVEIQFCSPGFLGQLKTLVSIINSENIDFVIDNTLSGTMKLRFLFLVFKKKIVINTVVQQLASLSSPIQRYKRMFYAQFSNNLIINSINYGIDWNFHKNKNFISKFLFSKKFQIIRNGVYLPRIPIRGIYLEGTRTNRVRLVFLGRLKSWKGIGRLKSIDKMTNSLLTFLIITSDYDEALVKEFREIFNGRVEFMFGKTLRDYSPQIGDVHIYPVDYGIGISAIESVSTNCLEMALLGIPSIVTKGGTNNWPELRNIGIVVEVEWEDKNQIFDALDSCNNFTLNTNQFKEISNLIDIQNNLLAHKSISN